MGAALFCGAWIALWAVALFRPRYAYFMFMNQRRRPGQAVTAQDLADVPQAALSFYRIVGAAMCLIGVLGLVLALVYRA